MSEDSGLRMGKSPVSRSSGWGGAPLGDQVIEQHVATSDVELFVRMAGGAGRARTAVLLHGGPGLTHHYMVPLQRRLASDTLRVLCFDQRGAGASTRPETHCYGMGAYVSDLESLRAWLGIGSWIVLGHSWGGLIAQAYAAAYPQHVVALVLVSSMSPHADDNRLAQSRFVKRLQELTEQGRILSPLRDNATDDCRATTLALLPAYFGDPDTPVAPELLHTGCRVSVHRATIRMLHPYDFASELRALHAPAAVIVGERDPFGTDCAIAVAEALQHVSPTVEILPRVGHFPWLEEPATLDRVDAIVRELLRDDAP
ncbi:MAG: alpha/beta fold hydrolase [Polyangiaceae bacterium]|nr:alpha/beta fold hydrolase [Polyangiaceae bacterium]